MVRKMRLGTMRVTIRVLTAAAVAVLVGAVVPSANAAQYDPTSSRGFTLAGHGYGHGRGLSQWGAYGAATKGVGLVAILDFYYPGTTRSQLADAPIRVSLSTGSSTQVAVDALGSMAVTAGGTKVTLPATHAATGRTISAWRLVPNPSGSGLRLDFTYTGAGGWVRDRVFSTATAEFTSTRGTLRLIRPDSSRREYRGSLRAVRNVLTLSTINVLPMESYLRSVVPAEMPASWPATALAAQAVAARTYAAYKRARATGASDICDTTACQVYAGKAAWSSSGSLLRAYEVTTTDSAITASRLRALRYGSGFALTEFSSSNGGYTVASSLPYQVAKPDPYDGAVRNTANSWTKSVTLSALSDAWPSIGTAKALVVNSRDGNGQWGGRVTSVSIVGTHATITVTGARFTSALGLRSTWWRG